MNKINTAFRIALLFLIVITCCFFTSCGENAQKFTYSDNVQGIDNEFMHLYISKIKGVNKCELSNNYYHREIIGDIVDEYINGEIATEKFLSDLNSKTTIFLEE